MEKIIENSTDCDKSMKRLMQVGCFLSKSELLLSYFPVDSTLMCVFYADFTAVTL